MAAYPKLSSLCSSIRSGDPGDDMQAKVIPYLIDVWLSDYSREWRGDDIVETTTAGFSYLFDIRRERLLAAWGVSKGRDTEPRPDSRMKQHPRGGDRHYHRGHAIPHTLGGATDINLVPQRGSVNVGPFRILEIEAVATPGALYFTYWSYARADSQRPSGVDQGLIVAGKLPRIVRHAN
jgi:hypothetical protein